MTPGNQGLVKRLENKCLVSSDLLNVNARNTFSFEWFCMKTRYNRSEVRDSKVVLYISSWYETHIGLCPRKNVSC